MAKQPVTGTVEYISKRGTEVRLEGDPKRYRGAKLNAAHRIACKTAPIFRWAGVKIGDTVTLHWGGFADLNIIGVNIHFDPNDRTLYPNLG